MYYICGVPGLSILIVYPLWFSLLKWVISCIFSNQAQGGVSFYYYYKDYLKSEKNIAIYLQLYCCSLFCYFVTVCLRYIAVQCNLDYPDFVYPDPQLSRLAGDQKVHYHACAEDVANDSYGCGYRLSDELWTLQACLGQNWLTKVLFWALLAMITMHGYRL